MTYIALFDSWLVHGVSRDRRSLARDLGPSGGGYQPGAISRAGPVIDEKACAGGQFVAGRQADGGAGKGQPREQNSRTVHLLIWARAPSAGQGVLLSPAMVGVRYLIASAVAAPGLKLLVLGVSAVHASEVSLAEQGRRRRSDALRVPRIRRRRGRPVRPSAPADQRAGTDNRAVCDVHACLRELAHVFWLRAKLWVERVGGFGEYGPLLKRRCRLSRARWSVGVAGWR